MKSHVSPIGWRSDRTPCARRRAHTSAIVFVVSGLVGCGYAGETECNEPPSELTEGMSSAKVDPSQACELTITGATGAAKYLFPPLAPPAGDAASPPAVPAPGGAVDAGGATGECAGFGGRDALVKCVAGAGPEPSFCGRSKDCIYVRFFGSEGESLLASVGGQAVNLVFSCGGRVLRETKSTIYCLING
jgi:hypothetical protein